MLRSIGKQSGESVSQSGRRKGRLYGVFTFLFIFYSPLFYHVQQVVTIGCGLSTIIKVKRSYVGLVAVGVQEQAEDVLVPPLLRNCLTCSYVPLSSHYLPPQSSGPCNSFYCLGHSKNVYDDDDDDDLIRLI